MCKKQSLYSNAYADADAGADMPMPGFSNGLNLYFSDQIEFDLKSINQEFLLFLKLLKKHSIQYLTIEL